MTDRETLELAHEALVDLVNELYDGNFPRVEFIDQATDAIMKIENVLFLKQNEVPTPEGWTRTEDGKLIPPPGWQAIAH